MLKSGSEIIWEHQCPTCDETQLSFVSVGAKKSFCAMNSVQNSAHVCERN